MQFDVQELTGRVQKLQADLQTKEIDLAILSQNSDVFYYSGSIQPLYLVVPATGEPFALARKATTRIASDSPHLALEPFSGGKDMAAILARHGLAHPCKVGFTLDTLSYNSAKRFVKLFPDAELADIAWDLRMLRVAKSDAEIAIQERAGQIMEKVPEIVRSSLEPGMTELELSALLESYFRLNGHGVIVRCRREGVETLAFGVCSSGVNSLAGTKFEGICSGKGLSAGAPYGASTDAIEEGVPVILDFGFNLDGYIIDQTRMASIGEPADGVLTAYDAMVRIEADLAGMLRPGTPWEDIYHRAVELADMGGYSDTFMGIDPEKVSFVGHGVGLELDEPPYLAPEMKFRLEAGMVLAIEPKVALPGVGVVGIEDTYVVRERGADPITTADKSFIIT